MLIEASASHASLQNIPAYVLLGVPNAKGGGDYWLAPSLTSFIFLKFFGQINVISFVAPKNKYNSLTLWLE